MSAAKQKAQKIIDDNSVVVFSKSYCPYCRASKSLLNEKHAKYFLMELDEVGKFETFSSLVVVPGSRGPA
jgi:glutaredoxin 3